MVFDYKESKKRVLEILSSKTDVEKKPIPKNDKEFTYANGIKCWVGAMFIDIVDSSSLFKDQKDEKIARIVRSYTSEIIEILKSFDKVRQIGIRGDCVFAIYAVEYKNDLVELFRLAYLINTYMNMLNVLLEKNSFPTITAGIGLGASENLVIKAGLQQSGYNDLVFIGDAVVDASNLSGEANRHSVGGIAMNTTFYDNIIDTLVKENQLYSKWIVPKYNTGFGSQGTVSFYHCEIVQTKFNDWINKGMKDAE